jgi:glycerophosphoryl diester phosphodiesterase
VSRLRTRKSVKSYHSRVVPDAANGRELREAPGWAMAATVPDSHGGACKRVVTAPWVIAHRGGPPAGVPENSLEAFAGALAAGADMVELDVRRSADGRLVVIHDGSAAGLAVRRASLAALRSASGRELVELRAVAEFAAGRIGLDVELKETGYEHEVIGALEPARAQGRPLMVTSFRDAALRRVRRLDAEMETGLLLARGSARLPRRLRASGARYVLPPVTGLRRGVLDAAAAAGVPVIPWTVNAPADLELAFGHEAVAGVITDLPELGLQVRAALATT